MTETTAPTEAPALDQDCQRLLDILTDPANAAGDNVTRQDQYEHLAWFEGYLGDNDLSEVQWVSDRLFEHYDRLALVVYTFDGGNPPVEREIERKGAPGGFVFSFEASADGEIGGGTVAVTLAGGGYLSEWIDRKNFAYRRTDTGLDGALSIAQTLDDTYRRVLVRAQRSGLLETEPLDRLRAVAAAEQVAVHYQDRGTIEAGLGRPLSDGEWARVVPSLEGYDQWLDSSVWVGELFGYWRTKVFAEAGVPTACRECDGPMFLTDDEVAHHYLRASEGALTASGSLPIDHDRDAEHVAVAEGLEGPI